MPITPYQSSKNTQQYAYSGFRELLKRRVAIFDGAMGTSIQNYSLTIDDFNGKEGCNEYLCITRPDIIQKVHESYLKVGSDCIETNTFGANRLKLKEYGLDSQIIEINRAAVAIAKKAISVFQDDAYPRYIAGSIGPTGFLPSSSDPALGNISVDLLQEVYFEQSEILINAGVDILLIETGQDILEMKHAVIGAKTAIVKSGLDIVIMAQPTLDASGRMLLGTDLTVVIPLLKDLGVDVIGLNCSTGPDEMRESIRYLSRHSSLPISVIPNAGLPENLDGHACYTLQPRIFAKKLKEFAEEFGVEILGGCCGTTPGHIAQLVEQVKGFCPKQRILEPVNALCSPIKAVNLDMDSKPIIVGERLNTQGSRKFKQLLIDDEYETIIQIARTLVEEGAHLLDICVALNEKDDELNQMSRLVRDLSQQVEAPLMIDSTEPSVIEAALKLLPGRSVINSIHLEGKGERLHNIIPLLKKYGGAAVAMLIDENGMAKTFENKIEVAKKIYRLATEEYKLSPDALIFDPLTFTLATGELEFRNSAIDTFNAIRWIKANLPGSYTILGVSNASFGLTSAARKVLNSVYLYHATKAGLDLAIVNTKEIIPYTMLTEQERELADALIMNEKEEALADFIAYFESYKSGSVSFQEKNEECEIKRTVEEQIHYQVLNRKKDGIEAEIDKALEKYSALEIINNILLPAMKEVGDKMASGELILPFVLQSAEVMKKSITHLEQFLSQEDQVSKGVMVLATVYGDVHDIGKNLVKTILTNNGYTVHDLGKQVPLQDILAKAKEVKADAIALSALLITTSKQMAYCVEECQKLDLTYPIIIGGAAINKDYGFRISCLGEELVYPGGVFYAKDAFECLKLMNRLQVPEQKEQLLIEYRADIEERHQRAKNYQAMKPAPIITTQSQVSPAQNIPTPPFWGMKLIPSSEINLDEVYPLMDFPSLFRLSWGLKNRDKTEYEEVLKKEFYPLLANLLEECKRDQILQPQILYGYFPCYAEGNDLVVMSDDFCIERSRFSFPRQTSRDLLCLSDYFICKNSNTHDVLPLQLVTMGRKAGEVCNSLHKGGEYSRSYYLHGLSVQMTDALAEWAHRYIRKEMGILENQGKRYSFGYPACPDLSYQVKQFELMEVSRYLPAVKLTEAYQIEPEQSTSALVVHHPEAKYYSII